MCLSKSLIKQNSFSILIFFWIKNFHIFALFFFKDTRVTVYILLVL